MFFFSPLHIEFVLTAWLVITLGAYTIIDWLGVLPPPFEPKARSLLQGHDSSHEKGRDPEESRPAS